MNIKAYHFILPNSLIVAISLAFLNSSCDGPSTQSNGADQANGQAQTQLGDDWVDPLFFIDGQLCQHLRKIFEDSQGNLWLGTNVYGLMRYNGDTLEYFTEIQGLGSGRITGIAEDRHGNVWFSTAGGLSKYDPTQPTATKVRFTNYTREHGLSETEIWSLMIDKDGLIWVGTINGVFRFDGQSFKPFELPKPAVSDTTTILSFDRITSIIQDREGGIWFGRDGFGITRLYQGSFQQFHKENGLPDNSIHHLMEDRLGNVWIGTMFGGLTKWTNGNFHHFRYGDPIKGWEIGALFEDDQSNVWFASENHGVYKYDAKQESFKQFFKEQGLPTNGILSIYQDRSGRFWMGGWGGLFRYFPDSRDSTQLFSPVTSEGPWN